MWSASWHVLAFCAFFPCDLLLPSPPIFVWHSCLCCPPSRPTYDISPLFLVFCCAAQRCAAARAPPTGWRVVYTLRQGHTVVGGTSALAVAALADQRSAGAAPGAGGIGAPTAAGAGNGGVLGSAAAAAAAAAVAAQRLPCQFGFAPVGAPNGHMLRVAVEYAPAATVALLEQAMLPAQVPAAIPPPPTLVVIPDYVPGGAPAPASSGATAANAVAGTSTGGHSRRPSTISTGARGTGSGLGAAGDGVRVGGLSIPGAGAGMDRAGSCAAVGAGGSPFVPGSYNPTARVLRRAWSSKPPEVGLEGLEGGRSSSQVQGTGAVGASGVVVREVGSAAGGVAGQRQHQQQQQGGPQAMVVGSVGGGGQGSTSTTPRAAAPYGRPPLHPSSLPSAVLFAGPGDGSTPRGYMPGAPQQAGAWQQQHQGGAAQLQAMWAAAGAATTTPFAPAGSLPTGIAQHGHQPQQGPHAQAPFAVATSSLPKPSGSRAGGLKSGPPAPAVLLAGFQPVVSCSGGGATSEGSNATDARGMPGRTSAGGSSSLAPVHQQQQAEAADPLSIPRKGAARNWSETDMASLGGGEAAVAARVPAGSGTSAVAGVEHSAAAAAVAQPVGGLRQQLTAAMSDGPFVGAGAPAGGAGVVEGSGGVGDDGSAARMAAELRRLAPSSAPAAPRGMLGLALCAQKQRELEAKQQQQQQVGTRDQAVMHDAARDGSGGGGSEGSGDVGAMSGLLPHEVQRGEDIPGTSRMTGRAGLTVTAGAPQGASGGAATEQVGSQAGGPRLVSDSGAGAVSAVGRMAAATAPTYAAAKTLVIGARPAVSGASPRASHGSSPGVSGGTNMGRPSPASGQVFCSPYGTSAAAYPLSCSPQLPFAFTPSATPSVMSLQSHFRHVRRVSGPGIGPGPQQSPPYPSPPLSSGLYPIPQHQVAQHPQEHAHSYGAAAAMARSPGIIAARDISSLAIIRRPSWREHSVRAAGGGAGRGRSSGTAGVHDSYSPANDPWSFSASSFDVAAALAALPPVLPPGASNMLFGGCDLSGLPGRSCALPDTSLSASILAGNALVPHGWSPVPGTPGGALAAGAAAAGFPMSLPSSLPIHSLFPFPFSPPTPRSQQQQQMGIAGGGSSEGFAWGTSWVPHSPLALMAPGHQPGDLATNVDGQGVSAPGAPMGQLPTALLPALPPVLVVDTCVGAEGQVSGPQGPRQDQAGVWGEGLTGASALNGGAGAWDGAWGGALGMEEECEGDALPFVLDVGGPLGPAFISGAGGVATPGASVGTAPQLQLTHRLSAGGAGGVVQGGGSQGAATGSPGYGLMGHEPDRQAAGLTDTCGSNGDNSGAGARGCPAHQLPLGTINQLAGMLLGREGDVGAGVLVSLLRDAAPLGALLLLGSPTDHQGDVNLTQAAGEEGVHAARPCTAAAGIMGVGAAEAEAVGVGGGDESHDPAGATAYPDAALSALLGASSVAAGPQSSHLVHAAAQPRAQPQSQSQLRWGDDEGASGQVKVNEAWPEVPSARGGDGVMTGACVHEEEAPMAGAALEELADLAARLRAHLAAAAAGSAGGIGH